MLAIVLLLNKTLYDKQIQFCLVVAAGNEASFGQTPFRDDHRIGPPRSVVAHIVRVACSFLDWSLASLASRGRQVSWGSNGAGGPPQSPLRAWSTRGEVKVHQPSLQPHPPYP